MTEENKYPMASNYRLTEQGVIDLDTGASIPNDANNRHWQGYQAWLAEGNTPEPIPEETAPERSVFTKLQIRRAMRALEIESKLDTLLAASEEFAKDWSDALEINLSDSVTLQALEAGTITSQNITDIKAKIIAMEE